LTPEGVKQLPIITKKEIENKENRIRPGESLVIGGIRKTEKRDVVRGVPLFQDIPLLGFLFSGRDFEERAVETIFVLTPTISTGGVPTQQVVAEIEKKHQAPAVTQSGNQNEQEAKQNSPKVQEPEQSILRSAYSTAAAAKAGTTKDESRTKGTYEKDNAGTSAEVEQKEQTDKTEAASDRVGDETQP
jgi:type II secretory pathway component GspD/PulD (secretin)